MRAYNLRVEMPERIPVTQRVTASRLANQGANAIMRAFALYQTRFQQITQRAQERFEARDWRGMRADATERLDVYRRVVDRVTEDIRALLGPRVDDQLVWAGMKAVYSSLLNTCDQWELAETFFNSITRRIFATVGVHPEIEFVDTDFDTPPTLGSRTLYRTYDGPLAPEQLVERVLAGCNFRVPFRDRQSDAQGAGHLIAAALAWAGCRPEIARAEIIRSIFYRGNGAYVIGRFMVENQTFPLVLALHHEEGGIALDAVLLEQNDVSILFSFAHSYFQVEATRPYDLIRYLKLIVPRKRVAELYISMGFNKQGKTELYRDLLQYVHTHEDERFEIAPGERGMVMTVFTVPGYDMVFKVIMDRFARPKETTRREVMARYGLVHRHDRAGRLVDAQEFEHLSFPANRFAPELLDELRRVAGHSIKVEDESVVISHAYVERRVVPLNIYLHEAEASLAEAAVLDYGRTIKDLTSVNIFPGDLLLKNFGVTPNGRVVFYDYDEVSLVTDLNFRSLPAARSYDEELSDAPWLAIEQNDVFPEEFARFLGVSGRLRSLFLEEHGDLFQVEYWRQMQQRLRDGDVMHVLPYDETRRLSAQAPATGS